MGLDVRLVMTMSEHFLCHSGMTFIADNTYPIENSASYSKIKYERVKSVEFIRGKGNELLFVEAKKSFPTPNNAENKKRFRKKINDICEKFIHSLHLYSAIKVGVVTETLPDTFKPASSVYLQFVLVIKDFEHESCEDIQTALTYQLYESIPISTIWKPAIYVINDAQAKKFNLIT